jgi:hypothetical protein
MNRREFLKFTGLVAANFVIPKFLTHPTILQQNITVPNILLIVFDAFSAYHISLDGYPPEKP